MVVHWLSADPLAIICPYLDYDSENRRMSNNSGEYVSFFRVDGVRILPPILTEEDRQKCRNYRQQAINVEKKLQEKRLRKKRQLEVVKEESECDISDSNNSSGAMEVMQFIRQALGDSHDLEEVKFLISQVGEELKKRKSLDSHNSTYNDVDSISFTQNTPLYNLEVDSSYSDRESVATSGVHLEDHKLECEKPVIETLALEAGVADKAMLKKFETVISEIEQVDTKDLITKTSDHQLHHDKTEDLLSELSKNDIGFTSQNEDTSEKKIIENGMTTPPKLIRSNSYTLESPSPTVLAYLRSLTLDKSGGKGDVPNKVVKNLNNYWDDEEEPKKSLNVKALHLENGNENLKPLESDGSDHELNGFNISVENGKREFNFPVENNGIMEEKLRAATAIQAAARGFLVRRLMKTQKIKDLKIIIKEAVLCAWSLYGEQAVSPADIQLHERIIQQVTAACYELHCIFFNWSTADRMALIRSDREKMKNPKPIFRASRERKASESSSASSSGRSKSASSISRVSRSSTPRELQRPTTLPTSLRKNVMQQHWSR